MKTVMAMIAASALAFGAADRAKALTVAQWVYDESFDATLSQPIIGLGTLTTSLEIGPGTYALDALDDLTIEIEVAETLFTLADLQTPLADVDFKMFETPGGLSGVFLGDGAGAQGSGSAEFLTGSSFFLTHEPTVNADG
ncbi:MAG: hypothetical protein AAFU61_16305, partial [Pseudomonadota bacterium]